MSAHTYPMVSVELQIAHAVLNHVSLSNHVTQVESSNITFCFTAILVEEDGKHIAQCKEISYVYGQGETQQKALDSLLQGISDELNLFVNEISLKSRDYLRKLVLKLRDFQKELKKLWL